MPLLGAQSAKAYQLVVSSKKSKLSYVAGFSSTQDNKTRRGRLLTKRFSPFFFRLRRGMRKPHWVRFKRKGMMTVFFIDYLVCDLAGGGGGGGGDVKFWPTIYTDSPELLNLNLNIYLWRSGEQSVKIYYHVLAISTAFSLRCETFCILQTIILIFSCRG